MAVVYRSKAWLQSVEVCWTLLHKVRTFIFSQMDKFISWQRLVLIFICFIVCGQKENVLIPQTGRVKDSLVPNNWTEVLTHPDYDKAKFLRGKNVIILLSKVNYI